MSEEPSPEELRAAWRQTAFALHPDHGGCQDAFLRAKDAYRAALDRAYALPCPDCRGEGRTTRRHGFLSVSTVCARCLGLGKRFPKVKL